MSIKFNSLVRLPERQWAWRNLTQVQKFSDQKVFKVLLVYLPDPEVALGFGSCSAVVRQQWCFLCSWPSPDKWKSLHFGKFKHFLKYYSPYLWIWIVCEFIWERHFCPLFQKVVVVVGLYLVLSGLWDMLYGIYLKSSSENWLNTGITRTRLRMGKEWFLLFSPVWVLCGSKSDKVWVAYLT